MGPELRLRTPPLMTPITNLGIGVGLRVEHYDEILSNLPAVDYFEIISENFMVEGGAPLTNLDRFLEHYTIVQHGVSMSLASADSLDFDYLKKLKRLVQHTKAPFISDHLCWTRAHTHHYHDLLPLPYTSEYAAFIAEKARIAQDFLEVPLGIENLSSYVSFKESTMTEWEFYAEVIQQAGVYMMLDANNIYVSSVNHNFNPDDYLNQLPFDRIVQVHLAGHTRQDNGLIIDSHDNYVCNQVWDLYAKIYKRAGGVSTLLEWDDKFIPFNETLAEAHKARQYQDVIQHAT